MRMFLTLLLATSVACSLAPSGEPSRGVVLTTFPPLYSMTARVIEGSPRWTLVQGTPRTAEVVVAFRSLPVPGQDQVYAACRRANIRVVEIDPAVTWESGMPKLPLIADPVDSAHGKVVEEPEPNPHVWLGLTHATRLVEMITRDFMRLDPEHQALYRANADRFQKEIRSLKAEFEKKLAGIESLSVASLTEAFPYLCADFGIGVAEYLLETGDAAEVAARVRAARVKVVLAEEAPDRKVAEAVSAGGARLVVLTTLEEGEFSPEAYLEGMRANLSKLFEALSASSPK
jgi:ABC-type Zn uptake system ZnuABC Zn-binding protein ZnuA